MSGIDVTFTLATTIDDVTFGVTHGDSECIKHRDIPDSFSESNPAVCTAKSNRGGDCFEVTAKIHVYIWSDTDETDQLVEFKMFNDCNHDYWIVDVLSIVQGYNLNYDNPEENQYTLTLANDQ